MHDEKELEYGYIEEIQINDSGLNVCCVKLLTPESDFPCNIAPSCSHS